jgi:hypothetical protein
MMDVIRKVIEPRPRDLGGFSVRRVLPAGGLQMVGPFIFFDHIGPATFEPGRGVDVRPHPHIGLATVTYLFEGAMVHRDSLGVVQTIEPGAVNWMTAGRGIVHSERTGEVLRASGHRLHGIQSWVALPLGSEEAEPSFRHHPADTLPEFACEDARVRVIAGSAFGECAPVAVMSPTLYVDVRLPAGGSLWVPVEHEERALYVADGAIRTGDVMVGAGRMAVFEPGVRVRLEATEDASALLLGGARADGARYIWWNFVSSSRGRIEVAKRDWAEGRFPAVPGETERIPLPELPAHSARMAGV